jgi:LysM repeat protein
MGITDLASKLTGGSEFTLTSVFHPRQLVKAKFQALDNAHDKGDLSINGKTEMEVFLNPKAVKITRTARVETAPSTGEQNPAETRSAQIQPMQLDVGELIFDTYESRKSVRKEFVEWFEHLAKFNGDIHVQPCVRFLWGEWGNDAQGDDEYVFYLQTLTVNYTMFLPDGKPVRATATLALTQANPPANQEEKGSPDHAKLYTIRRGDTLQGIANAEYNNPGEWRRIADLNGITDPLNIKPGSKILVPPILR